MKRNFRFDPISVIPYEGRTIDLHNAYDLDHFGSDPEGREVVLQFARNEHAMDQTAAPPPVVVDIAKGVGVDVPTFARDRPGMSTFVQEGGVVYHTYSTYARGLDGLWSMYQWLDRAPKGRNEEGIWWKRHDEYAQG